MWKKLLDTDNPKWDEWLVKSGLMYIYVDGVLMFLCIITVFFTHANISIIDEFGNNVAGEFYAVSSVQEFVNALSNLDALWLLLMMQMQYQFITRFTDKFLPEDTLLDKILHLYGYSLIQVYLLINYTTYSEANKNALIEYTLLIFLALIFTGLGRAIKVGVENDFPYFIFFQAVFYFFASPLGRGWLVFFVGFLIQMSIYLFVILKLAYTKISFLLPFIFLILTYIVNKLVGKITDLIIENTDTEKKIMLANREFALTDIMCFGFAIILCTFWLVTKIFNVTVPCII